MRAEITVALIGVAVLVGLVALRGFSGGKLEVKLTDAAIACIPFVLWLVASGQVKKLVVGAEGITVETAREAILDASARPIESQITPLPVVEVEISPKGPVSAIPALIERGTEAIEFVVGTGGYFGPAVQRYLTALSQYSTFKYVVISRGDRTLFGVFDARKLTEVLAQEVAGFSWDVFADVVNADDKEGLLELGRLAGMIEEKDAVGTTADKREVLERMETLGSAWLPVLDTESRFAGVVDRSRLTASLILDVAGQLKATE